MKSNTTTMLDRISTSIEKAARALHGAHDTTKRMTLRAFVPYAIAQLQKAGAEERALAKRRLGALKRSVDQVAARIAKLNAEDLDSEKITVDVETAFAPAGDAPSDDLTTSPDQSSSETALTSVNAAGGDTNFAQNLAEVSKALEKLQAGLDAQPNPPRAANKSNRATAQKGAVDRAGDGSTQGWPLDLNTPSFRTGVAKAEDEPAWGYDSDAFRATKAN
ncbi:MAG TPA: hypothetical protein VFP84_07505 [Kofleriaceae bacterium]|nr:hypothetical protein [Kofleriaceae bacterium]